MAGSGERASGVLASTASCAAGAGGATVSGGKLIGTGGGCRRAGGRGGNSGSTGGGVAVVGAVGALPVGGGFDSSSAGSSLTENGSGEKRRSALPVGVLSRSGGGCVSVPNAASNAESATDHLAPGSKLEASADALKSKQVHLAPADGVADALVALAAGEVGAEGFVPLTPAAEAGGRSSPLGSGLGASDVDVRWPPSLALARATPLLQ